MSYTVVRVRLPEELFRKYKVFCAIKNMSMTENTEHIVREFIKSENENIKIINIKKE